MIPVLLYYAATWLDWEEIMALAGAVAALGWVYAEVKRERRLDALAIEHAERLARLEATATDDLTVEARIRDVEIRIGHAERIDERFSGLAERVRALEVHREYESEEETDG
jgi:hypothetical protein